MIIGVLSELTRTPPPTKVFDLGTGSGILAIAAAKLFLAPVIGVDIDPLAISNARENVALNGVESLVSVSTDPIEAIHETFPLIVANVYGEALAALSQEITRIAEPRCSLVLSGISELVCGLVLEAFCDALGWRLERELSQDGWVCLVLQRV
jgi:ribosomal protein L11 methyltransferase